MNEYFYILLGIILLGMIYLFAKRGKKTDPYKDVQTKDEKRRSPHAARYDYVFDNGIKAYQEELTFVQDKKLAELIIDLDIKSFDMKLLDLLVKNDLLEKFLGIILHVNYLPAGKNYSGLRNSEIEVVLTDFFTLNPLAKKGLSYLSNAAVLTGSMMNNSKKQTTSTENVKTN